MQSFDKLTRLGQLRRIRELAEAALNSYGLCGARLTFLRYFANATYRVDVPGQASRKAGPYMPNRFLLRVLCTGNRQVAEGEMTWLAALSHEAGLPVPQPVPTLRGELLTRIATPGMPEGRLVSLMRCIEGRKRTTGLNPHHFRAWGRIVARLHAFAEGWSPPKGFVRFVWDWDGLLGGRDFGYTIEELVASMPDRLQEPFQAVSQDARAVMDELGKGPDAYGMIHGDMYADNLLFKAGEVYPIDFEDCGFGYWLWDIAIPLCQQPWTEEWHWQRDAFLRGYAQVRTLPDAQLQYLDLFMAVQYAVSVLWASHFMQDQPGRKAEHEEWRDREATGLLRYMERC